MTDISVLIKEAKPLYFKRKRRNQALKTSLPVLALATLFFSFTPRYENDIYSQYWDLGEGEIQQTGIIEEMGLPTDDYGFLKVY